MSERLNPPATFVIDVGFTTQRPIIPDQHTHRIVLAMDEDDPVAAQLLAAQWINNRDGVVMATSTRIVSAVL